MIKIKNPVWRMINVYVAMGLGIFIIVEFSPDTFWWTLFSILLGGIWGYLLDAKIFPVQISEANPEEE